MSARQDIKCAATRSADGEIERRAEAGASAAESKRGAGAASIEGVGALVESQQSAIDLEGAAGEVEDAVGVAGEPGGADHAGREEVEGAVIGGRAAAANG